MLERTYIDAIVVLTVPSLYKKQKRSVEQTSSPPGFFCHMKWETLRYSESMFCSVENVVYIAASMVGKEGTQYHTRELRKGCSL